MTYANGRLELRELVLVILSLGLGVLLQPRSLFLKGIKDSLLVVLGQLSTKSLGITNLVLEGEDEVWYQDYSLSDGVDLLCRAF